MKVAGVPEDRTGVRSEANRCLRRAPPKGVRHTENRAPEEGIAVLTWSLDELAQAMTDGRFSMALHVAAVMMAVLKGGLRVVPL